MAQIELEHITKVFAGGTVAVDDVNLRVEDGEFMVLVGPSGCGKSTLLRMIAGLEEITQGEIAIGGQVVIRPMMYLALSYDHRVVDGQGAVTFLVKVKEAIEDPQRMLLEV